MTSSRLVWLLAGALASGAWAQTAPLPRPVAAKVETGPAWASLTPQQQRALAPLQGQWSTLDATRKSKWLTVAQRFPAMPREDQQRLQARMAEWARLAPPERGRARQNFQELRHLPMQDRQALWDAYQALPEEQRLQLAQRAKARTAPAAAPEPSTAGGSKGKVALNHRAVVVKQVTPTVVQAKPGGTTTLVNRSPSPPAHHQPGMPKIVASKDFVNPATLLPSRGPQGAAAVAPKASEVAPRPDAASAPAAVEEQRPASAPAEPASAP